MLSIESIEITKEQIPMCDIEVDDIHCFNCNGVIVHNSGAKNFIDAFKNGEDPHAKMAKAIWGEANYDKNKRSKAKEVNFGVAYGATPFTFIQRGYSEEEANKLFDDYWKANPDLALYQKNLIKSLYSNGGVAYSYFKRPRRLKSSLLSSSIKDRKGAERQGLNHVIQGTAADVIRRLLYELYIKVFKGNEEVKFAGTIHDEVLYYIKNDPEILNRNLLHIVDVMEQKDIGVIPLIVEVELGPTYGDRYTFDYDTVRGTYYPRFI